MQGPELTRFLVAVLLAAAATLVFTRGSIFEPLRKRGPELWRDLVSCPLCSGVWVGMATALWLRPSLNLPQVFLILGTGALTGVVALTIGLTHDFLGSAASVRDLEAERLRDERDARRKGGA